MRFDRRVDQAQHFPINYIDFYALYLVIWLLFIPQIASFKNPILTFLLFFQCKGYANATFVDNLWLDKVTFYMQDFR